MKPSYAKTITGIVIAVAAIAGVVAVIRLDPTGRSGSGLGPAYAYDIEDLARIEPNLLLYEERHKPIRTGFSVSRAVIVEPRGRICVAGDKAVRIFDQEGKLLSELALPDEPRCLATNSQGSFYIGFKNHIEVYNGQGKRLAAWQELGPDAVLTSITVSKDNVFVADAGNRVVWRFDASGNLIKQIGRRDRERNIPGFVVPSPHLDLAIAPDGLLRVVNPGRHRIEAYTFDGDLEFWWGKFSKTIDGFTGCCNPVNFAVLNDGSFVTCEKGLVRVKLYDSEGRLVGVVAGPRQLVRGGEAHICEVPAECQSGGFDVAVDAAGRVLVLDTIDNIVRIFTRITKQSNG